ncbi:putative aldouronate transport system permease protein [Fontibacillus solani]|uniref:Putative aldouronate transport system permease protein n=1 Tax=Fontibacillus solani TaxID=1572857 RepID=A0A7W3XRL5_9BACL|nr:carbohydrate ABC transporter permease [Fontibacillus solani]MBA9085787.1 putative aldouronate transport system permease protein [Fontibacillus solani]
MKQTLSDRLFTVAAYVILTIFTIFCTFPFLLMIIGSFTKESELIVNGYSLFPKQFSVAAYQALLQSDALYQGYGVTVLVTVAGTLTALCISAMLAYSLANKRNVLQTPFLLFCYLPMLFSGGIIPFYIVVSQWLNLQNSIWVLILPLLCQPFLVFLLVSFFRTVPEELEEAARIDGANEMRVFFQIILPISKPILASVGLFYALYYWNDWFMGLMFVDNEKLFPLQLILRRMVSNMEAAKNLIPAAAAISTEAPTYGVRMATTVLTIGPIILLYPMLQKYFVKGLTVGAVKG